MWARVNPKAIAQTELCKIPFKPSKSAKRGCPFYPVEGPPLPHEELFGISSGVLDLLLEVGGRYPDPHAFVADDSRFLPAKRNRTRLSAAHAAVI